MRWAVAIAYAALIMTVSSIPSDEFALGMPLHLDKVAHALEYAILALLVCRAARATGRTALVVIIVSCTAYGIIDELHQFLIAGRDPNVWDAAADAAGSAVAAVVWYAKGLVLPAGKV